MIEQGIGVRRHVRGQRRPAVRLRAFAASVGIAALVVGLLGAGGVASATAADAVPSSEGGSELSGASTPSPSATIEVSDASDDATAPEAAPAAGTAAIQDSADAESESGTPATDAESRTLTVEPVAPDVAPLSIPNPGPGNVVISVKVAGDRIGGTEITGTGLAGVHLRLGPSAGNTASWQSYTWATCVSDVDGDCNFVIPVKTSGSTDANGMRTDADPWVHQISAPTGWRLNTSLRTGHGNGTSAPNTNVPYRFQVDQTLQAGRAYRSTDSPSFMRTDPGDVQDLATSSGVWQIPRVNPGAPLQCGADYGVLIDLSSSIGSQLPAAIDAVDTFVDALRGTPSRVGLFSFDRFSPASEGGESATLRSVRTQAEANVVKNMYDDWEIGSGTNWDAGLHRVATAPVDYDVVIVLTDGNPTAYGTTANNRVNGWNGLRDIEAGVLSSNLIKSKGTRVVTIGVGAGASGLSELNLQAISGPVRNSDYFQVGNYNQAATTLASIAKGNCEGSIDVVKRVIAPDAVIPSNPTKTDLDAVSTPVPGWQVNGVSTGAGVSFGTPAGPWTTDGAGGATIPLLFPTPRATGPVTWTETQQSGYSVQPVRADASAPPRNAVCVNTETGNPVSVSDAGTIATPGVSLPVAVNTAIECTIYNRPATASISVTKKWVVDGEVFEHGAQPTDLTARLRLTGPGAAGATDQPWGTARDGYLIGQTVTVSETVGLGAMAGCTSSAAITSINAVTTNIVLGAGGNPIALTHPENTATVTNTVTCEQELTLVKEVSAGTEPTDSWTLSASGPSDALPGPIGRHSEANAVSAPVSPAVAYSLSESGGPATYVQTDAWQCVRTSDGATPVPVDAGNVRVPAGIDVTCTVTNATATITLIKRVRGDGAGVPGDWHLTATPAGGLDLDPLTVEGQGGIQTPNTVEVRPGHTYTLSEALADPTSPLAYRLWRLQVRDTDGSWTTLTDAQIVAPPAGETAVYRFVNEAIPAIALPLTGGAATDLFVIAGGGIVAVAMLGLVLVWRRRRAMA
ncbi:LPXTG cell wall anchor domain-containing protein [Microbacterium koreense]|uniref:LPXTG cell wall anchor domain-containing protein n=1 Tax=Microbacterium koreense TaxID=323761 RepID=A0ABW2ZMC5_9MICO